MNEDELRLTGVAGTSYRVVVLAIIIALALLVAGKCYLLPAGHGEAEAPRRILVVGIVEEDLAGWLDRYGFEATSASWFDAEARGQEEGRAGLEAVLHHADVRGFAFVAMDLGTAPPWFDLAAVPHHGDDASESEGRRIAVMSAGDFARANGLLTSFRATDHELRFGAGLDGVRLDDELALRYALITGLFRQSVLDDIRHKRRTPSNELTLGLERGRTLEFIEQVEEHLSYLEGVRASWESAISGLETPGRPFEETGVEPLAGGTLLVAAREGALRSARVDTATVVAGPLGFWGRREGEARVECAEISGARITDDWDGLRVARDGRALALWKAGRVVVFAADADPEAPCRLAQAAVYDAPHLDALIRMTSFGEPAADGRAAFADAFGFGLWDGAKLKKLRLGGVDLGPSERQALRWVGGGYLVGRAQVHGLRADGARREPAVVVIDPGTTRAMPLTAGLLAPEEPELQLLQVHVGADPGQLLVIAQRGARAGGGGDLVAIHVSLRTSIDELLELTTEPELTDEQLCAIAVAAPAPSPELAPLDEPELSLTEEACLLALGSREDTDRALGRSWVETCLRSLGTDMKLATSAPVCLAARRTASGMASEVLWGDVDRVDELLREHVEVRATPLEVDAAGLSADARATPRLDRLVWMPASGAGLDVRAAPRVLELRPGAKPVAVGTTGGERLRIDGEQLWLVEVVKAPPEAGAQYEVPVAASRPLPRPTARAEGQE